MSDLYQFSRQFKLDGGKTCFLNEQTQLQSDNLINQTHVQREK